MSAIHTISRSAAVLAFSAIAVMAVFAGSAAATKPTEEATHGKRIEQFQCEGLGTVTVSASHSEKSNGVGQIVGERGHGIPVTFATVITDVSTGTVLVDEANGVGSGHGHPNQQTTTCTGTFEAAAAQFFGEEELPEGVEPADLIRAVVEIGVIVKK
jgi:hypothetical protein